MPDLMLTPRALSAFLATVIVTASAIARFLRRSSWAMPTVDVIFAGLTSAFAVKITSAIGTK
jgi:threonine/homoserine/homoserine lactone efflux protein